ncbi:MAG: hypothetical protein WBG71_01295 [Leeuwenhoekiella sp.]
MESSKKRELARFNMPFELGIDLGCKSFGFPNHREKYFLILDKTNYRYQKAISDLSGNDIGIHNNSPEKAVRQVRNWFRKILGDTIDSASNIWLLYAEFDGDFFQLLQLKGELNQDDIDEMPWDEYVQYIKNWLKGRKKI